MMTEERLNLADLKAKGVTFEDVPGMEQDDKFDPYKVMLLTDGEPKVFADVRKASQQRV